MLSHLAAAGVSCTREPTAVTASPAPEPPSTATTSATSAPNNDGGAEASPDAVAVSVPDVAVAVSVADAAVAMSPDAGKAKFKFPAKCFKDSDCGPDAYCVLNFNGANFEKGPGYCSKEAPIYEGRPLVIDGEVHVASAARPAAALEEHASVAAFARTIASLLALGAPRHLVEKTSRALHDEIRHAEEAWVDSGPGPLPAAIAPFPALASLPAALVVDVFRGGCLGETRASARALARGDREIGEDEARHAALAFETALWLANHFADARSALDRELAACDDRELAPLLAVLAS